MDQLNFTEHETEYFDLLHEIFNIRGNFFDGILKIIEFQNAVSPLDGKRSNPQVTGNYSKFRHDYSEQFRVYRKFREALW